MRTSNLIQFTAVVLCLVQGFRGQDVTLVDTFNEIYDTCLVHLSVDCVQPKAFEWLSKSIHKREIRITDDLTIVKNATEPEVSEAPAGDSARDNRFNLIGQVDEFLTTHYLQIRYPKSVISQHVPSFMLSAVDKLIPDSTQVPLEETNVNQGKIVDPSHHRLSNDKHSFRFPKLGRGLVKKVLIPFLLGLKFKTTVLLPLAFALIALKAWKALTLGLLSLVVSAAVVVFKLSKPKVRSTFALAGMC